jgi:signal transduction histidine kinase/ActR/RegA family two-component response regulator
MQRPRTKGRVNKERQSTQSKAGTPSSQTAAPSRNDAPENMRARNEEIERLVCELGQVNTALRQSQQSLAAELQAAEGLQEVSTKLIQTGEVKELYEQILNAAIVLMGSDMASIQMLDPDRRELRLLAWKGFHPESAAYWERITVGTDTSCGAALKARQRLIVPDVWACEWLKESASLKHYKLCGMTAMQSTPLTSRDGRLVGMISTHWRRRHEPGERELRLFDVLARVAADLLERKRAEEDLERLVTERTAKLKEMVEELEHFSYTITHDLKAPLRAMRGFAELATMMCGDGVRKEAREALAKISTSAERMDNLITDALNYSRAVRQELPLADVDSGALLRGMLDSYPELQPPRAHIQVEGELPAVLANEAGLTQCFSNLLSNAVKFVRPGEKPQIQVRAEARDGAARIWVEDRGIGISKEMLPRVFEMFSRGGNGYEGTGVGLALVRKVTKRMGGTVGVESEEEKGSRFWIELKLSQAPPKNLHAESPEGELKSATVLYVEDEETDATFMRIAFAKKGLDSALRVVGDGRAAIQYLSGTEEYADRREYPLPSVVLLDLNLPQVPGFEVLKWMRNQPEFARTPVVVFSSSTREDDRAQALELGATSFLTKPNSGMKFGDVVDALKEKWLTPAGKGTSLVS